jgi:UDP-N-acetylglucosamine 2-epimerase (non-hydrolysing)
VKLLTVLGTRPEIIRLSLLIEHLDAVCEHRVLFTGQNSSPELSTLFFDELGVRPPDIALGMAGTGLGNRIGQILTGVEEAIVAERPDRLVVLGDTDSALCAVVANGRACRCCTSKPGIGASTTGCPRR